MELRHAVKQLYKTVSFLPSLQPVLLKYVASVKLLQNV